MMLLLGETPGEGYMGTLATSWESRIILGKKVIMTRL